MKEGRCCRTSKIWIGEKKKKKIWIGDRERSVHPGREMGQSSRGKDEEEKALQKLGGTHQAQAAAGRSL